MMFEATLCLSLWLLFVGIESLAERIKDSVPKVEWDFEGIHFFDNGPLTVQYLFVLDALNFCFWPGKSFCSVGISRGILLVADL